MAHEKLGDYRRKRTPSRTPEPFGGDTAGTSGVFVVQMHDATRVHWDLRLELDGVLLSWVVPKGPSLNPEDKRLAVRVEDHPLEYADFEGVIPDGNYGAGAVILWDRGRWEAIEDPITGLRDGKLLFDLHGHRLRGRFTLVRTARDDSHWLLIKKPDAYANPDPMSGDRSILSGLTTAEIMTGADKQLQIDDAPSVKVELRPPRLMLCETSEHAFDREGWIFELKYDGFRLAAVKVGDTTKLFYRSRNDATDRFPDLVQAVQALPVRSAVIDGEVTVLDEDGKPSFNLLQQRASLTRTRDIRASTVHRPATFFAFDLLAINDRNLRGETLIRRRSVLKQLVSDAGPIRFSDDIAERGVAFFREVQRMGLEGVVAKDAQSHYEGRRSERWLKIKTGCSDPFVVVGYTPAKDGSDQIAALAVAAWDGESLRFAARVGTGFDERLRVDFFRRLERNRVAQCPCDPVPDEKRVRWCEPREVVQIEYPRWTNSGHLWHPVFIQTLELDPVEVKWPRRSNPVSAMIEPTPGDPADARPREVPLTNRNKVFWPDSGYTKSDLIDYYTKVSEWLLPYLEDRPVVLTRYPDGITGKSFFQKDAPEWTPRWVQRVRMWSEHAERDIDYFVVDSVESLTYLANSASIPLHVWASRVERLGLPDWSLIDLDPKGAAFEDVVTIAREIHRVCEAIELPSFVKTTGSSGLHIMVPLGRTLTYEQSRTLADIIARVVVARLPEISTLARSLSKREGRVYLDTGQNRHGQLMVAPFSVRPLPDAPVSMPLRWSQVTKRLHPRRFTIANAEPFLRREGDAMRGIMEARPDVMSALKRLHDWLNQDGEKTK
ncbi:MAG: DNA ligase D [Myxococcota bacterium]